MAEAFVHDIEQGSQGNDIKGRLSLALLEGWTRGQIHPGPDQVLCALREGWLTDEQEKTVFEDNPSTGLPAGPPAA